ncbi:hypothetical protein [Streptomyces lichenis]|uniref:Uncharacterized protein n=1 Tax=Streptomyces lichenis TaxID=2306967 RepID=A0ABT0IJ82_9ACTN|nr:hypothetical protein [Streptomyces lichenis]MCK8681384.1 hypothetical protein [Streptomyces lichenis]
MENPTRKAAAAALLAATLVVGGAGAASAAAPDASERITSLEQLKEGIALAAELDESAGVTALGHDPIGKAVES